MSKPAASLLLRTGMGACLEGSVGDFYDFTPEQRFFLGWELVWGTNQRAEAARLQTNTYPHPLVHFRGNGPISNMEAFAKAFDCKNGDLMVREQACKIW